ncbi:MAG: hypothetical protein ACRDQA_30620 [Nocardioidaceae bacterium]
MTQPPEGEAGGGQSPYPQQHLLPQQVKPGRSRKPLVIGAVVVVLLIIGGLVTWRLVGGDGEGTRAEYCSVLKDVTHNGDLMGAVEHSDKDMLKQITRLRDLAPGAVSKQWDDIFSVIESSARDNSPSPADAFKIYSDVKSIAADAKDKCGLDLDLPL